MRRKIGNLILCDLADEPLQIDGPPAIFEFRQMIVLEFHEIGKCGHGVLDAAPPKRSRMVALR